MHAEKVVFLDWSYVKLHDEGNNVLPYHLTDADDLFDKILSFWQPKYAAGVDLLSTGTGTGFESLLFTLLPTWFAYGFYKVFIFFIGGFFTFKLLRDYLGTNFFPATLAGVLFLFLLPDQIWNKMSILALPAAIYAISWKISRDKGVIFFTFLVGALYEINSQITLSLTLLSSIFIWLLFIEHIKILRAFAIFLSFSFGVIAVEFHTIWAFVENSNFSHRGDFIVSNPNYEKFLYDWTLSVVNLSALLLLISFLITLKSKTYTIKEIAALKQNGVIFLIASIISLYQPTFEILRYYLQDISTLIGGYSITKGLDNSVWFALSAGLSLNYIEKYNKEFGFLKFSYNLSIASLINYAIILAVTIGILQAKITRLWDLLHDENFSYMYRHPDLLSLAEKQKNASPFRVATPFIISETGYIIPTFMWAYGFETVDGYVSMYPEAYNQFWQKILATHNESERVRAFKGANSELYLYGNPTDRGPSCSDGTTSCPVDFDKNYDIELLSLANVRFIISARRLESPHLELLDSSSRDKLIELQGSRLIERLTAKLAGEYVGPPLYIYENTLALPRFFLTKRAKLFNNREKLIHALSEASTKALQDSAFFNVEDVKIEELDTFVKGIDDRQLKENVDIISYKRDEIILQVHSEYSRPLIVTNNFSPFWKAEINDQPMTIFPVYNAFQGMFIPKGKHLIRLSYLPPYSPRAYFPKNN